MTILTEKPKVFDIKEPIKKSGLYFEASGISTESNNRLGIKIDFHKDYENTHSAILWLTLNFGADGISSGKKRYANLGIQKYWLDDIIMASMPETKDAMSK